MFILPTEYYQGINIPSEFNLKRYIEITRTLDCDIMDRMELVRRIGSESLHAKVYAGEVNETIIAVKNLKDPKKFDNEILINNIVLDNGNNNLYFLYLIKGLVCEYGAFLIMEMGMCDIKQRMKYSINLPNDIYRTVSEVLQSLLRLARLGIYHGDLHLGNVFLVKRNGELCTVIGDFGESLITDSPTASSSDLFQFINAMREKVYRSEQVMYVLNTFYSKIGKIAGKSELYFDELLDRGINERTAAITCNVDFIETCISEWMYTIAYL